jgi:hypothetical protein
LSSAIIVAVCSLWLVTLEQHSQRAPQNVPRHEATG